MSASHLSRICSSFFHLKYFANCFRQVIATFNLIEQLLVATTTKIAAPVIFCEIFRGNNFELFDNVTGVLEKRIFEKCPKYPRKHLGCSHFSKTFAGIRF